jgi:excisionase family DNA binding protein
MGQKMKTNVEEKTKTLTTEEAAKLWNIPKTAVRNLVHEKKLNPIIGFGTKGWRFLADDFEKLCEVRLWDN